MRWEVQVLKAGSWSRVSDSFDENKGCNSGGEAIQFLTEVARDHPDWELRVVEVLATIKPKKGSSPWRDRGQAGDAK